MPTGEIYPMLFTIPQEKHFLYRFAYQHEGIFYIVNGENEVKWSKGFAGSFLKICKDNEELCVLGQDTCYRVYEDKKKGYIERPVKIVWDFNSESQCVVFEAKFIY